jgi:hypothetical protein
MNCILRLPLIVFCIVCITGCPPPSYTDIITGNDVDRPALKGSYYNVYFYHVNHFRYNGQKIMFFDMKLSNSSGDTRTMICSKSVIYSKTDTFTWQKPDERFKHYYFYDDIRDTVILAPKSEERIYMLLVGKKNYSRKMYTKTNKADTLYLKMNLFNKDTLEVPMRNHFRGAIWNSY